MMMDGWGYGNGGYDGNGNLGGIMMMVFVVMLLVVGVYVLLRIAHGATPFTKQEDALTILKRRYARGEIDRKEFEEKKKAITE